MRRISAPRPWLFDAAGALLLAGLLLPAAATARQHAPAGVAAGAAAPGKPSAPQVAPLSATSLAVSWSEPANAGPAIHDYDVQYRESGDADFISWPHAGARRTTNITNLTEGTAYDVQVLARNADGESEWSRTASARPARVLIPDPPPWGPVPTEKQMAWQALEYYGFIHYGLNTYTSQEWGLGSEKPSLFDPEDLDPAEWARVAKNAGMKGLIFVAKHHSGFALWPSAHTKYSIKNSPWKSGNGDVLKELADACRAQGIKLGIYYSPWDRNSPAYGATEDERNCRAGKKTEGCPESVTVGEPDDYVVYMRNQLREVLDRETYGEIFEVWFDGTAPEAAGYYKGYDPARTDYNPAPSAYLEGDGSATNPFMETRQFRISDYDWPGTTELVYQLQPDAVIWGAHLGRGQVDETERWIGADVRWSRNEHGEAPLENWSIRPAVRYDAEAADKKEDIHVWRPMEADLSIRSGWFWSPDSGLKSLDLLHHVYYATVGRNSALLLNLAIDVDGEVPAADVARLNELKAKIDGDFKNDLALLKAASATDVRAPGAFSLFRAENVNDGDPDTYWAVNEGVEKASVTIDLGQPTEFNRLVVQEYIGLGQRVEKFSVEYRKESADGSHLWERVPVYWYDIPDNKARTSASSKRTYASRQGGDEQTTIGYKRILQFDTVRSSSVRLNVLASRASPLISNIELYKAPGLDPPAPLVYFAEQTYDATEDGRSARVSVRLSSPATRTLRIPLTATPTNGATRDDYTVTPWTATFPAGRSSVVVYVVANDDETPEVGEEVVLTFRGPLQGARVSNPPHASTTVSLVDNDDPAEEEEEEEEEDDDDDEAEEEDEDRDDEEKEEDGEDQDDEEEEKEEEDGGDGAVSPPGGGGGGGGGTPPSSEEEDRDDPEDDGGGNDPGGGAPPRAAVDVDAECTQGLCRARTGEQVAFEDASAGAVRFRRWEFSDGRTSRNRTVRHVWTEPGFQEVTLWTSDGREESTSKLVFLVEASRPAGDCEADAETLCLRDSRYRVRARWRAVAGEAGPARVVRAGTNDSGMFRFFDRDNWEVLVKVLDGCALNGAVWVFGASTTDLGYTIEVADTVTGAKREYRNQPGRQAPAIRDTEAFPRGCRP